MHNLAPLPCFPCSFPEGLGTGDIATMMVDESIAALWGASAAARVRALQPPATPVHACHLLPLLPVCLHASGCELCSLAHLRCCGPAARWPFPWPAKTGFNPLHSVAV